MRICSGNHGTRRQAGDTIVEVLISITVVAVILTGAFVVSRSSLTNERDSEEHGQALNLLQQQIEVLRHTAIGGAAGDITYIKTPNNRYCFAQSPPHNLIKIQSISPLTVCNNFNVNNGNPYTIILTTKAPSGGGNYTVLGTVSWPSLNGGTSQEQIYYRVLF